MTANPSNTRQTPIAELIAERLTACFAPLCLELQDESAAHAGHAGAASGGGHYRLTIVSAAFVGQPRIARHRMVYDSLSDFLQKQIHALSIQAFAPDERSQQDN